VHLADRKLTIAKWHGDMYTASKSMPCNAMVMSSFCMSQHVHSHAPSRWFVALSTEECSNVRPVHRGWWNSLQGLAGPPTTLLSALQP
jgi:hypothetical protein